MTRPTRRVRSAFVALVVIALGLVAAPPALAATTCVYSDPTLTITTDLNADNGDSILILRGVGTFRVFDSTSSGLTQLTCSGSPTLSNTDTVNIVAGSESNLVRLGWDAGPYEPGKTDEGAPPEIDEIEFNLNLGGGTDTLMLSNVGPLVTGGTLGIDVNADGDPDVMPGTVSNLVVLGWPNSSTISMAGNATTGAAVSYPVTLCGSDSDDSLTGGAANDDIAGGGANDHLAGGAGDDTLGVVTFPFCGPIADDGGNDVMQGDDGVDDLIGGSGSDRLIKVGSGDDTFAGGDGLDTADFSSVGGPTNVSLDDVANDGQTSGSTLGSDDVGTDVENVIGTPFADGLTGSSLVNKLTGGGGADIVAGAGGNDNLLGGSGNNTLKGGGGSDTMTGGTGKDQASGGGGSDTAKGGGGNDVLSGNDGNDHLFGQDGADGLVGGAGIDECVGGAGSDVIKSCELP